MDPLSVIAACIAIGTPIVAGLQKLREARHAQSEILTLSNELAEIIVLLQELHQIIRERNQKAGQPRPNPVLLQALDSTNKKLEQLSAEIAEWNQHGPSQKTSTGVHRLRWARITSKVNCFQDDLRNLRSQLVTVLSAMTFTGFARVEMSLQDIFLLKEDTAQEQLSAHQELRQHLARQGDQVGTILELLSDTKNASNTGSETQSLPSNGYHSTESPVPDSRGCGKEDFIRAFHHNGAILFESAQMTAVSAVGIRTAQFPRTSCTPWCSCACHQERYLRSPRFLEQFIGSLFIGYSGLPVLKPPCSERKCHLRPQPITYVTYFFPKWFLSRMISFMMTVTPLAGPVASLKVQRTVPGSADIFTYAKLGNVDGIRALFENGLASPHDVQFDSGITPLHMAINHQHIRVCQFLLQANADPFPSDHSQYTAADSAWTKILSRCLDPGSERAFRHLFSETECVERRNFTVVHKTVLRLVPKVLEEELEASTAEINSLDSVGRTPLSLAAERGDIEAVETLLKYGADCTIASHSATTPLHYAAFAKEPGCIGLLLDAGVDVDCMTNWNQTPLHLAAAYVRDARHAELLLDAGASPNQRDRDGITPLGWCAISNNPEVASALLRRGAEVNRVDLHGSSPLQQCIKSNRHEILRLFRSFPMGSMPCDRSIWELIATHADVETMQILGDLNMGDFAIDPRDTATIDAILSERADISAEIKTSFYNLFRSLKEQNGEHDESLYQGREEEDDDEDVWEDAQEVLGQ